MEVRKGKFIWMEESARKSVVTRLRERMKAGYYTSEKVVESLVERLAPEFHEQVERI
ncbi:MAG: hypothetical protein ABIA63_12040 [bacterium]